MAPVKENFTLYLAPWQVRMAKDFLPRSSKKIDRIIIRPRVIKCPASYKIPIKGFGKGDWVLYLTDEQMAIIKDKFNLKTAVSGINVTDELLTNNSIAFM
jgi:hypothetical protein